MVSNCCLSLYLNIGGLLPGPGKCLWGPGKVLDFFVAKRVGTLRSRKSIFKEDIVGDVWTCPAVDILKVTHKGAARCDAACSPLPWQLTRPGNIAAAWRDYPTFYPSTRKIRIHF